MTAILATWNTCGTELSGLQKFEEETFRAVKKSSLSLSIISKGSRSKGERVQIFSDRSTDLFRVELVDCIEYD